MEALSIRLCIEFFLIKFINNFIIKQIQVKCCLHNLFPYVDFFCGLILEFSTLDSYCFIDAHFFSLYAELCC
jgi:hypothetical protein